MQTQLKVTKNENGLLYRVVNLNFDDYYLLREAVTSKICHLENRLKLYVLDVDYISEVRNDLESFQNLLKKL